MSILSAKRQVTLPEELCDRLHVLPGDQLEFLEHNACITIIHETGPGSLQKRRHSGQLAKQAGLPPLCQWQPVFDTGGPVQKCFHMLSQRSPCVFVSQL